MKLIYIIDKCGNTLRKVSINPTHITTIIPVQERFQVRYEIGMMNSMFFSVDEKTYNKIMEEVKNAKRIISRSM